MDATLHSNVLFIVYLYKTISCGQLESNKRHPPFQDGALPTELQPHLWDFSAPTT